MMSDDDNDGRMVFRDLGGLKCPDICLTVKEKPQKKPQPGKLTGPGLYVKIPDFHHTINNFPDYGQLAR